MSPTILKQLIKIRDSGIVNMCDLLAVQRVAFDHNMYELVLYIEDYPAEYFNFILYGDPESS